MLLESGTKVGPYEILEPLGAGGMGEVYRARDERLDRDVAIKILSQRLNASVEALARFDREIKVLAALSHPNIVTIHDCGNQEDFCYMVMELLEGETLRELMRRSPLASQRLLEIAIAVTEGLSAAHSKAIVHRDLKPENVFLTTDGRVKILDFGLARLETQLTYSELSNFPTTAQTQSGMMLGTVGYMSPEQVRGEEVDARSDIFSFGCLLFEMVTGKRPFERQSVVETMVAVLKEDPEDLLGSGQGVPAEMERIIRVCLEKNPNQRFQSAHDLTFALQMISRGSTALDAAGIPYPVATLRKRSRKAIDSIAILPLVNLSGEQEADYLSDGITETIINSLAQIPKLRVMARSTVFRYKGKHADPVAVGRELRVRAVLTGTVAQRGEFTRIQTELVDANDGSQLWGEQYNQEHCDLLSLQERIASKIYEKLRLKLTAPEKKRLKKRMTKNDEAYKLYLKGRYYWNRRTEEGMRKSIDFFEQAIAADPDFALAYAGLADGFALLAGFGYMSPDEGYTKAKVAALRSQSIDDTLAEPHTSLGMILYRYEHDWAGAEREFKKALELNPNYVTTHNWYSSYLLCMGKPLQAREIMEKGLELDPLAIVLNWSLGYINYANREFDRAIEHYRRTLELEPTFWRALYDLGIVYVIKGDRDQARAIFEEWMKTAEKSAITLAAIGYIEATTGSRETALERLHELEEFAKTNFVSPFSFALIHIVLGNFDRAFEYLEESVKISEDPVISFRFNPRLDPLRNDPRFIDILRRSAPPQE